MSTGKLTLAQITGASAKFYEHCYVICQPDSNGCITSAKAAELLKTSGLSDQILSEIWENSDSSSKGFLTKYDFHVALKLVALAQSKVDPKIQNLHLSAANPRLNLINPYQSNATANISPVNCWCISSEEQTKYSKVFDSLDSANGKLSGDAVKSVFINSKLPVTVLGQVWTLSDIDKDGSLDREEFILAMYLIYKCLAGEEPLKTLPANLIPPSKRRPSPTNSIQSSFRANTSNSSLTSSTLGSYSLHRPSTNTHIQSDWVVSKLEKERYDSLFFSADKDRDGLLSGLDIKDTFVQSGLSQVILAKIWDLCDVTKSGMLNSEQFSLAMHLINDQISSAGTKPIPSTLTADMVPPSLRIKNQDNVVAGDSLSLTNFGIKVESDDVYREIETLRRERAQVEEICRQCEADYKGQMQEVQELQDTLEQAAQTAQTLSKQREEAQHRLDELTEQRNRTQVMLDDTRSKCKEEREQLETLKRQIGSQSASIEEKRDELKRLQCELNDLIREETSLRDQVGQHHSRLVAIEQETSSTETQIMSTEVRNKELETLRSRLHEVLAQYDAVVVMAASGDHQVDMGMVPDAVMVDGLLASTIVDHNQYQHHQAKISVWPTTDDPFMKDDPFSSVADPFASVSQSDPFSSAGDPFSCEDPFSSSSMCHDPFSLNNGWSTTTKAPTTVANTTTNDQNHAFSAAAVDDLFKNMDLNNTSSNHNNFQLNDDLFGFGDSPFDNTPEKISMPPPRPTKAPQAIVPNKIGKSKIELVVSETEQLNWAKQESEREARDAEAIRRREQADYEMALKLSQVEYKSQERVKKTHKNKK